MAWERPGQLLASAELSLSACRAVEREGRRLVDLRIVRPIGAPAPPAEAAQAPALLAAHNVDVRPTPPARPVPSVSPTPFHGRTVPESSDLGYRTTGRSEQDQRG